MDMPPAKTMIIIPIKPELIIYFIISTLSLEFD